MSKVSKQSNKTRQGISLKRADAIVVYVPQKFNDGKK